MKYYSIIIDKSSHNKNKLAVVYSETSTKSIREFVNYNFNPGYGTYNHVTWVVSNDGEYTELHNHTLQQLFEIGVTCENYDGDNHFGRHSMWNRGRAERKAGPTSRNDALISQFEQMFKSKNEKTFTEDEVKQMFNLFKGHNVEVYALSKCKRQLLLGFLDGDRIEYELDPIDLHYTALCECVNN